jgi:uncharacterized protein DUF4410
MPSSAFRHFIAKTPRLTGGEPLPKNGWLVRGIFTEVDQGSRVLRSQVGFGADATDLAVLVNVGDLQKGKLEPFYKLETQAGNCRRSRYQKSLCGCRKVCHVPTRSTEKVRQTAKTIADQIISRAAGRVEASSIRAV